MVHTSSAEPRLAHPPVGAQQQQQQQQRHAGLPNEVVPSYTKELKKAPPTVTQPHVHGVVSCVPEHAAA